MLTSQMHSTNLEAIDLGRATTNVSAAIAREWLVTNGIGGYASGTVASSQTRRYHGLLVAALNPPLGRTVLLSRLDETIAYGGQSYPLFTNQWNHADAPLEPPGFHHLERFRLEGTTPIWDLCRRRCAVWKSACGWSRELIQAYVQL